MLRREFLTLPAVAAAADFPAKRLAAAVTTYHVRSHADNVVTRFLEGYWINDRHHQPTGQVVSLYMDQVHPADVGQRLASAYGFPVVKSIRDGLTMGTGKLAVDGVIIVAEHGEYPFNDRQQQLYPRFEFFEQVVNVFRESGRSVPVFTDKHLSYDWKKAKQMYDWSHELKFPMMAGSSCSVTFRRPELDPPLDADLGDVLAVGSGWVSDGGIFHNLEVMQCFAERRRGGETGVRAVEHLQGEAVWKAAEAGRWSKEMMQAALGRAERPGKGRPEDVKNPVLCLLEYNDGFRAGALMLPGFVNEYLASCRMKGKAEGTLCYVPTQNSNNFSLLVDGVARMFDTGKPTYPVERTLLTTGALARLMESAHTGHRRIETPELKIAYRAPKEAFYGHGRGS